MAAGRVRVGSEVPDDYIPVLGRREDIARVGRPAEHVENSRHNVDAEVDALDAGDILDVPVQIPHGALDVHVPYNC